MNEIFYGCFNIRNYFSKSSEEKPCNDGMEKEDWTSAFVSAIEAAEKAGGGIIYVPPGKYRTFSIQLKSNMTLYLCPGAELDFIEEIDGYKIVKTEFEGILRDAYMPCIYAYQAENVSVKGEGIINGNGRIWWEAFMSGNLSIARPYLICFQECENVKVEGVFLKNSPCWTVHMLYCNDVLIEGITIRNPSDSPNTDGIDPDGCSNVRIQGCLIDVGDDCIAIKSGTEKTPVRRACENILISQCHMLHGHGGVVIGSEMSGNVRNISVSDCIFQDTDRGLRIKTRRRRGGKVENIHFNNVLMDRVSCPFVINMYYFCGENGREGYVRDKNAYPIDEGTPEIKDIHISNVTVMKASAAAGFIYGLKEMPVRNVTFSNVRIEMDPNGQPEFPAMMDGIEKMCAAGFYIRNAEMIELEDLKIENAVGEDVNQM